MSERAALFTSSFAIYPQLNGIYFEGYNINSLAARTTSSPAGLEADNAVDITEHEIHKINFIPDFWDMLDFFHSTQGTPKVPKFYHTDAPYVLISA